VETDSDKGTADLIIDILDEGPGAEIGSIDITGNKINSQEDILKYLGIRPGMPFTRDDWVCVEQKLWESARFIKSKVTPMEPASAADKLLLHLDLVEYPHAQALSKPLSQEEEILLRLQKWLCDSNRWDGDLAIRMESRYGEMEFIQSPKDGASLYVKDIADEKAFPCEYRIYHSLEDFGILNQQCESQFSAKRFADARVILALTMNDPYDEDKPHSFGVGLTFKSRDDEKDSIPLVLQLNLQPVHFLSLAHEHGASASLKDGILTINANENAQCWRVDAAKGRLISFTSKYSGDNEDDSDKQEPQIETKVEVRFETGAFKRSTAAIHHESKKCANNYVPSRPLGSLLVFICRDPLARYYLKENQYNGKWLDIADELLSLGVLDSLDEFITQYGEHKGQGEFNIPAKPGQEQVQIDWTDLHACIFVGTALNSDLFPRASWPWTLCQLTQLAYLHEGKLFSSELDRVFQSPDSGPLCFLAAGLFARYFGLGDLAVNLLVGRGMERMSKNAFIKDCRPLLSEKHVVGKFARRFVDLFRNLSEDEVYFIAQNMDEEGQKYLAECDRLLRANDDRPFDDVMPELLGALWDAGLESTIKSCLADLRRGSSAQ